MSLTVREKSFRGSSSTTPVPSFVSKAVVVWKEEMDTETFAFPEFDEAQDVEETVFSKDESGLHTWMTSLGSKPLLRVEC